jgi:hypothetical protein
MQPISSVTSLSPTAGTETTAAMDAAFIYNEIRDILSTYEPITFRAIRENIESFDTAETSSRKQIGRVAGSIMELVHEEYVL